MSDNELRALIRHALDEDTGEGDHSSLACIPASAKGRARLLIKESGIIAGLRVAREVFHVTDPSLKIEIFLKDGERISFGDIALDS